MSASALLVVALAVCLRACNHENGKAKAAHLEVEHYLMDNGAEACDCHGYAKLDCIVRAWLHCSHDNTYINKGGTHKINQNDIHLSNCRDMQHMRRHTSLWHAHEHQTARPGM